MNRIRIGLLIAGTLGIIYASLGLLDAELVVALRSFGIGLALAGVAALGFGLCDFIESHRDECDRRK